MNLRGVGVLAALLVGAGCAASAAGSHTDESDIRELERRAVGAARPYPAQSYSDADASRFAASKRARRELGWHVLAKALQPVPIAANAKVQGRSLPLFRTWLGGDEFERMFAKMAGDLGKERRLARDTPRPAEVDALFDWNATSLGPNSESEYFDRVAHITTQKDADGLGGNARVAYSPGYIKQYLTDYPAMAACNLEALSLASKPVSESNFTTCFSKEFPSDAAVIKASWRRNDEMVSAGLPVVDTSAPSLEKRVRGDLDEGGWNLRSRPLQPAGPDEAYTVRLSDESGYSLVGLHLMTKELRHWVWVTAWWSPDADADSDFGADRPPAFQALGKPWNHYKMCVVTDFEEKDPDPRGGFDGSLGDALAAVHGKTSWCSNSFIEKGAHNAQTNCIGCHQHAGDVAAHALVLTDEAKFPSHGNARVRDAFPADYSWAFATTASPDQKDRLLDVMRNRLKVYERDDLANAGAR
jgi:hypothetical protein